MSTSENGEMPIGYTVKGSRGCFGRKSKKNKTVAPNPGDKTDGAIGTRTTNESQSGNGTLTNADGNDRPHTSSAADNPDIQANVLAKIEPSTSSLISFTPEVGSFINTLMAQTTAEKGQDIKYLREQNESLNGTIQKMSKEMGALELRNDILTNALEEEKRARANDHTVALEREHQIRLLYSTFKR